MLWKAEVYLERLYRLILSDKFIESGFIQVTCNTHSCKLIAELIQT